MSNTRKRQHGKKYKTQKKSNNIALATLEQIKQNRRRNKMVRNIRMGRIQRGGGIFTSPFIGKSWTPDSLGSNYFPFSNKGVGTGLVPTFNGGQPLGDARYPTQLGPQLPKLGQIGGKKSRKNFKKVKGGGIIDEFNSVVDNVKYSFNNFNNTLAGTFSGKYSPTSPNPTDQPISKNML